MTEKQMKTILETIESPRDLKKLSIEQLEALAGEIRAMICEVVSQNGGHLAPSLGVVELTIALHATHDCPEDKIVWDVGHQAYAHKMLTGRLNRFSTIRMEGGLSGFPNINESVYDAFGTGHASTAISAALGLAAARDIRGSHEKVIAVVGDGSLTGGLSFEGLNNAGAARRDLMVILNDNKMAISPNVGALPKYLTDVISDQNYNRLKKDIWNLTGFIPALGKPARGILNRLERSLKSLIVPGSWFENLGFRYFGPVDGHDIGRLMQLFVQLKTFRGPILLHVYTTKGKGYCYAEQDAVRFHGTPAFERETGESKSMSDRPSYSSIFGETLCNLAHENKTVCAITAAMTDSTGLGTFATDFPDRFFDVGIAEGHAVTYAAGMARGGMKPFVTIYSSFMQRSFDNLIHDVALQKLPVVFCLDRAGIVGEDGPTHHGVFDLSFMRQIPDMVVMAPKDENELRDMLHFAAAYQDGPVSIRYPRGCGSARKLRKTIKSIKLGVSETLLDGDKTAILAIGETVSAALDAGKQLMKDGISAMVVNMRFAQPLDTAMLDTIIERGLPVITVEENVLAGGFGAAVMEYCAKKDAANQITPVALPENFIEHAERAVLISRYGLDTSSIVKTVRKGARQMTVAIFGNVAKEGIKTLLPDFIYELESLGIITVLHECLRDVIDGDHTFRPVTTLFNNADMIVSFGGDGTILHTAAISAGTGIPILGINLGKVGFLAEVSPEEIGEVPRRIQNRDYEILDRMAFSATTNHGVSYFALNDVVLDRNADTRILELSVSVDNHHAGDFFADGLIIATPTGSTAHSVSAGGPLVMPECSVIVLTPICPHSLTLRPMIIDGGKEVTIDVINGTARMAVDGQSFVDAPTGCRVDIKRAAQPVRVARFSDKTYFDILHRRLRWGVSPKMKNA